MKFQLIFFDNICELGNIKALLSLNSEIYFTFYVLVFTIFLVKLMFIVKITVSNIFIFYSSLAEGFLQTVS